MESKSKSEKTLVVENVDYRGLYVGSEIKRVEDKVDMAIRRISELRQEMKDRDAELRQEMKDRDAELRQEMRTLISELNRGIDKNFKLLLVLIAGLLMPIASKLINSILKFLGN